MTSTIKSDSVNSHWSAWIPARSALERAKARLGPAGPAELHLRLDRARRDPDLVARLDAIRLDRALKAVTPTIDEIMTPPASTGMIPTACHPLSL